MSQHTEMYVYEIAPENVDAFLAIKDTLIEETLTLPGLSASATFRSADNPNIFIDRMIWTDANAARAGNETFMTMPTAAKFMSLMAGPPQVGGGFELIAGA